MLMAKFYKDRFGHPRRKDSGKAVYRVMGEISSKMRHSDYLTEEAINHEDETKSRKRNRKKYFLL